MEYSKRRRNSYHRKLQLNTSINNQNEPMVWTDIALRCISIKMLRVIIMSIQWVCVKSNFPKHVVTTSFQGYPSTFSCEITVRISKYCLQEYINLEKG